MKSVAKAGSKIADLKNANSSSSKTDDENESAKQEETKDGKNEIKEEDRLSFLKNIKLKEFKINGMVGGGSGCIEYRDLSFQMTQGKTNGYTMKEMRGD